MDLSVYTPRAYRSVFPASQSQQFVTMEFLQCQTLMQGCKKFQLGTLDNIQILKIESYLAFVEWEPTVPPETLFLGSAYCQE